VKTALDSNVISAIWSREASVPFVLRQLAAARAQGALVISPIVFAELHAHPVVNAADIAEFLRNTEIAVDLRLEESVWRESGQRFARYAGRRRISARTEPRRLIADYVIGSHALIQADRLFTLDQKVYQQDFPELRLL